MRHPTQLQRQFMRHSQTVYATQSDSLCDTFRQTVYATADTVTETVYATQFMRQLTQLQTVYATNK